MAMSLGTARLRSFVHSASPSSTPASHHPLLLCFRRKVYSMELLHDSGSPPTMTISYLDKLNPQQRRAVEHGGDRVAGFRVVQLLPGAGPATAARVLDRVAEQSDPMRRLSEFTPPAAAAEYWPSFVDAVQLVHGKSAGWPAELDLVCRWYAPHLERIHEDAAVRQRDLVQLAQIASGYSSRERFLT